jgi:hypothetical protein
LEFEIPVPQEPKKSWVQEQGFGGMTFLKCVAKNQAFPGMAVGKAGCWRLIPTSDQTPDQLEDIPLDQKVKHC